MPKLLLITASAPEIRAARRARFLNFQQVTMPYLAARVPPGWEIVHVDEEVAPARPDAEADVVGITFHTPSAFHAYALADGFRARGVCVALGGPHATLLPGEAAGHCDVLFVGEAEGHWEDFLARFPSGDFPKVYRCTQPPPLEGIPMARKELFHRRDHTSGVLCATRGCPNACDFCSVAVMYRNALRRRPVDEVVAEYASFRGRAIIFWDDDLAADPEYAVRLFRALAPHRKGWSSQVSLRAGQDEAFLEAAARSGCRQLFIGLESLSQASLAGAGKGFNRVRDYRAAIARIHAHGIAVQAGIVFGFDQDPPGIFEETLDFLEDTGVQNATFNILTPYPGTPLFARLEAEGRILTRDWRRYNGRNAVVFRPKLMSGDELLAGYLRANARFYSLASIARRLSRSRVQLGWTLPLNLAYCNRWHRR